MHDQRKTNYAETLDYVPTPQWASRAFAYYAGMDTLLEGASVLEPGVGGVHMAEVFAPLSKRYVGHDLKDYGRYQGELNLGDFLKNDYGDGSFDWCITNPPFTLGDAFFREMMRIASVGVVLHIRTTWLNGVNRYNDVFSQHLPEFAFIHAKNVSATQGMVIRRGSNQFNHVRLVWRKGVKPSFTKLHWLPADSQDRFEDMKDYDAVHAPAKSA